MSVKGGLYMLKVFKNEKLWCAVAGAAAVIVGKKILKADKNPQSCSYRSCKGYEASERCKGSFPEYEG